MEFPAAKADAIKFVNSWREKFEAAKDIVLVGGGAVGFGTSRPFRPYIPDIYSHSIEYAGEIKDIWLVNSLFGLPSHT